MTVLRNSHRNVVAIFFETLFGTTPANAAGWAADEGTDTYRFYAEEADPSFILGDALLANADLQPEVWAVGDHHHGLPTADGGSLKTRLTGHGQSWADDTQVAQTCQGRKLEHALGAGARGHFTAIAAVASQTEFTLDSSDNVEPGYMVAFEDADAPGVLHFAQVVDVDGDDITIDRVMPFTVAVADKVHGCEMAWPDADALTNPEDAAFTSVSLLYQKGDTDCFMLGGGHLELQTIALERGQQPKLQWGVLGAQGYPPGAGAPTVPAWAGTIQGSNHVKAIGHGTKLFLQTKGTTTYAILTVFSATFTVGVPVKPQETITQENTGAPGRCGYASEPADTILEVVVALDSTWQTRWAAGTKLTATYQQTEGSGRSFAIHGREVVLLGPPEPMFEQSNKYKVKLQFREDLSATDPALRAKFVLARG